MICPNLSYVSEKVRKEVMDVLNGYGVHSFCKTIIMSGLEHDCIDAWKDAELATKMLKKIMDDCLEIKK